MKCDRDCIILQFKMRKMVFVHSQFAKTMFSSDSVCPGNGRMSHIAYYKHAPWVPLC